MVTVIIVRFLLVIIKNIVFGMKLSMLRVSLYPRPVLLVVSLVAFSFSIAVGTVCVRTVAFVLIVWVSRCFYVGVWWVSVWRTV